MKDEKQKEWAKEERKNGEGKQNKRRDDKQGKYKKNKNKKGMPKDIISPVGCKNHVIIREEEGTKE